MKLIGSLDDLTPDPANANMGTLRGEQLLEHSLGQYGAGRAIVVDKHGVCIGGNKTLQLAVEAGLDVHVVQTHGEALVAVIRTDLDLADGGPARLLAYFDNRTAELGLKWDPAQMDADLASGVALSALFSEEELRGLLATLVPDDEATPLLTLTTTLDFRTPLQQDQWLQAVQRINETCPGATFPDKLAHWLAQQMATLHAD
jgi:hypothetical protein